MDICLVGFFQGADCPGLDLQTFKGRPSGRPFCVDAATLMSAFGPKPTSLVAPHMSAIGVKADMTGCRCLPSRSLLGEIGHVCLRGIVRKADVLIAPPF
jgi:hypothetical protein